MSLKNSLVEKYGEPANLNELAHLIMNCIRQKVPELRGFAWDILYFSNVHSLQKLRYNIPVDINTSSSLFLGKAWIRIGGDYALPNPSDLFSDTLTYATHNQSRIHRNPWGKVWTDPRLEGENRSSFYYFDYGIFLDDWKHIQETFAKSSFISEISGNPFEKRHRFLWDEPTYAKMDDDAIRAYLS